MSSIRLSSKELSKFRDACEILEVLIDNPIFRELSEEVYGNDKFPKVIEKLSAIHLTRDKIVNNIKMRKEGIKKETFFTKEIESTEKFKVLWYLSNDEVSNKLRFTTKNSTCVSDIRIRIFAYINSKRLRNKDGVVKVDENMRTMAPETFGKMSHVEKGDTKTIARAINEISKN